MSFRGCLLGIPFGGCHSGAGDVFGGMSFGDPFWGELFRHLFGCLIVDAFLGDQMGVSWGPVKAPVGAPVGGPSKRVF